MEDRDIVDLFWQRDEMAIKETEIKYRKYLYNIALNILSNEEDSNECVNDTYMQAWQSIPPYRPQELSTFLGKITRRISIDLLRKNNAKKRGGGEILIALEELDEIIAGDNDVENDIIYKEMLEKINLFLSKLPLIERQMFVRRYWYMDSIADIAKLLRVSEVSIRIKLHRARKKLKQYIEKEGIKP